MRSDAVAILDWLLAIPDWLLYIMVASAAAVENLVPPFPGDVVVVVGGVIAGAGGADPTLLYFVVWMANVASALLVYGLGRRYGAGFFAGRFGRFLLGPTQVDSLSVAYRRFGVPIIFFSRFLPVFRPIVPVFAGVARLGFWRTALPILAASALWYGFLVYLGAFTGSNLSYVLDVLERVGGWLWAIAALVIAVLSWLWWRTRAIVDEIDS
jgi:membrane protein DedA with SNARE-associated domain